MSDATSPAAPRARLQADITAALTVALVGLPQCLAYALMSGLPPAYGLATAAVPGFVAALVGKSPHVVTGPTNTTGLLILAALGPFLGDNGLLLPSGLGALATLGLMAGLIRIGAAYLGGAALIDFIPASVLTGFTAGAGVLIAVMQLDEALGLTGVRGSNMISEITQVISAVSTTGVAWPAVAVTALTAAPIILLKRLRPSFPTALVVVVIGTLVAMLTGLNAEAGLPVVADRAAVPMGWPPGALPDLDPELMRSFLGPAAAIALLGTMELAVSARGDGSGADMKREVAAQGLANIAGAFTSAFPASASLTRSALLKLGGAQSRVAPALAALVVIPIMLVGGPFVAAMPQASLAGVLFVTALSMVKVNRLRRMWAAAMVTRGLLVTTFVSTLVLPLEWAIFLGVGIGLANHLAAGLKPRLTILQPLGSRLVPLSEAESARTVVVEVSSDFHFAAAGRILEEAERVIPATAQHVVIDLTHARALRFAALLSLERLATTLKARGADVLLAGVDPDFCKLLKNTKSKLPVFPYEAEPLASVRAALQQTETRHA